MARTADRENKLNSSQEYVSSPRVIYVRYDNLSIAGMDDLKGKTVAVPDGAIIGKKIAAQYPGIHLLLTNSDLDCIKAISLGKADAYVGDLTVATYLIMEHELPNIRIAAPSPFEDHVLSTRTMVVHFNDGSDLALAFERQTGQGRAAHFLDEALKRNALVVEVENGVMIIPFASVRWVEVAPCPDRLPPYAIRGARLVP